MMYIEYIMISHAALGYLETVKLHQWDMAAQCPKYQQGYLSYEIKAKLWTLYVNSRTLFGN